VASLGVREQARPEGRENAVDQLGDQLCAVLDLGKDEDHACGLLVLLAGDNDAGDRVAVLARRQGDPLTGNRGCWLDYALEAAVIEVVLDPQSPRHAALRDVHLPPDVGGADSQRNSDSRHQLSAPRGREPYGSRSPKRSRALVMHCGSKRAVAKTIKTPPWL
jgi:hypothetical protein